MPVPGGAVLARHGRVRGEAYRRRVRDRPDRVRRQELHEPRARRRGRPDRAHRQPADVHGRRRPADRGRDDLRGHRRRRLVLDQRRPQRRRRPPGLRAVPESRAEASGSRRRHRAAERRPPLRALGARHLARHADGPRRVRVHGHRAAPCRPGGGRRARRAVLEGRRRDRRPSAGRQPGHGAPGVRRRRCGNPRAGRWRGRPDRRVATRLLRPGRRRGVRPAGSRRTRRRRLVLAEHRRGVGRGPVGAAGLGPGADDPGPARRRGRRRGAAGNPALPRPPDGHCAPRGAHRGVAPLGPPFPAVLTRRNRSGAFSALPNSQVEAGYFFSVPPSVVRSPQKQKLVRRLPLSCMLLETDSPVLGPDRDQRNEPANAAVSLMAIAEIKGLPASEVAAAVKANTARLYG
ncbi:MAG: hypothetical protein F4X99_01285 [Gammaproteobacteria bacterium]|nr:hypothetical protein [Gammaproteobacteria bacterium]